MNGLGKQNPLSRTKSLRARLSDLILSLLAVAGGICIILVILAFTLNVSIMMFRTGSMEPTIPAGSIALVREIPATEMQEGDIITVDRGENILPVTHRVTDITDVDEAAGSVTFIMRGDANDIDDPDPYVADTVQRAFFSIPGVAPVIQYFQHPLVLGGLTIGATVLVVWAFWPREPEPQKRKRQGAHSAQAVALPAVLTLAAPLLISQNITTEEMHGDHIHLRSSGDHAHMTNLAPGQSATWAIDVWGDAPEPGSVDFELMASGQLAEHPDALSTEITICTPHPNKITECGIDDTAQHHVVDTHELAAEDTAYSLGTMSVDETRRVLVTATLADSPPETAQAATAAYRFIATGHGEQLSVTTPGDSDTPDSTASPADDQSSALARSGFGTVWVLAAALLLILTGALLARARNRKQSNAHEGG